MGRWRGDVVVAAAPVRRPPVRTCVACRTERPQRDLVRIVRTPAGAVTFDPTGHAPGRGAYLCADPACWQQAVRRSALQRALSTPIPAELRERLEHGDLVSLHGGQHGS
ncbi:MAG: YlxR family protein [Chloroflexi bacterium]|nr:YlxR family protein [Chloroflexota bacterium]